MTPLARQQKLNHSTSRTLAALVGSLPVALALGVALAASLPLPMDQRYLAGCYSVFPSWVALACCAFLAQSAGRAWLQLCGVLAIAGVVAVVGLGLL